MQENGERMRFADKVALVTGGGTGLGLATAKRFATEGAHVHITGRRKDVLDDAAASIEGQLTTVVADSTSLKDLDDLVETIRRESGRLDVLVANAGMIERADFGEVTEEHFDRTSDINARGTMVTVQTALPLMPVHSSITLVGSVQGFKGLPGSTTYSAAKAAVRSYARVGGRVRRQGPAGQGADPGPVRHSLPARPPGRTDAPRPDDSNPGEAGRRRHSKRFRRLGTRSHRHYRL
jgi:NAD(P)-dependent dehydrogenase (short-subunit alcohol dehydrogenase family)